MVLQSGLFDEDLPEISVNKKVRMITLFSGYDSQCMAMKRIGADFEIHKTCEWQTVSTNLMKSVFHSEDDTDYSKELSDSDVITELLKMGVSINDETPATDKEFQRKGSAWCRKTYNNYKATKNIGSITNIHGDDLEITDKDKYFYMMFYSFPCFTGDTLVLTKDGYKEIKDILPGDLVLTHDNTYQKVLDSKKTGTKNIYKIHCMGADTINCTDNHLFYVREMYRTFPTYENGKRGNIRHFKNPEWKECKALTKKDYLGVAINTNSIIPTWDGIDLEWSDRDRIDHSEILKPLMNNPDFWWIMGYYVGDGWQRSQCGIELCGNEQKMKDVENHLNKIGINYCKHFERTCYRCSIGIKEIGEFVKIFGKYADGKIIPSEVLNLPVDLAKAFLDGYTRADGNIKGNKYKISSVSRKLIYGTAQLVAKVYHRPYSIHKTIRPKTTVIEGRIVNQKDDYQLSWKTTTDKQDKAFYEDGYIWMPIYDVENTNNLEDVYDLTVEKSHSFTANGVIAHNCQDLSIAGKQKGMTKGAGTRSGLLFEVERLLFELRDKGIKEKGNPKAFLPDCLCLENVVQLHSAKNMPDFQQWINSLNGLGYTSYWQDCNAKFYGIPQNRDRTFMISLLGNYDYSFPETMPLEYCMADVLEDEVDEKYFINNERAENLIQQLIVEKKIPEIENE